jgi:flagellar M-ring protein FliF
VNETLVQYKDRVQLYWSQLSKKQKYMVAGIFAMLLVTVIILTVNLSKTEYATAFTNLQANDAAEIKGYLDEAKIPYELSADGRSIGVPRSMVASVKLDVESKGLNKSGSLGYGVFGEKSAFGTTDQEFNVKYINAVQGEIQQMFNQINGVNGSKVLITIPKPSAFVTTEKQNSSAAVVLNLAPGYRFDQPQIDTMYQLVAKSIPDLRNQYDNITISDQNGELLAYSKSGLAGGSNTARITEQFQIKKQFETDIQKKVQQILGGILGPNKVISVVTATMNFDAKSVQSQLVRPVVDSRGLDISIQEIERTYSSEGGAQNGGIPGTGDSDVPGYQASASSGNSKSEEIQRTVNREVDRITENVAKAPYVVRDLAINVGIEPPVRDDPNSLNPETVNAIRQILVSIVSASLADSEITYTNEQLAQKVTVLAQPFANQTMDAQTAWWSNPWLYGAGAALLLLGAGVGFISFRRKKEQLDKEMMNQEPAKVEYPTIDLEHVSNESQVRKQLEMLAQKKPDEFVELLRTWLVDE